jgi:short subunit fatty acids transporter
MFVFGVDVPLVEIIFAFTIIALIILVEITIILILIAYQMKNSKRLGWEVKRLSNALMRLEDKELLEIKKLRNLENKEKKFIKELEKEKIHHKIHRVAKAIITGIKRKKH